MVLLISIRVLIFSRPAAVSFGLNSAPWGVVPPIDKNAYWIWTAGVVDPISETIWCRKKLPGCQVCGDSLVDGTEQCDDGNLGMANCLHTGSN